MDSQALKFDYLGKRAEEILVKGAKLQTTKLYQCTLPSLHIYFPLK